MLASARLKCHDINERRRTLVKEGALIPCYVNHKANHPTSQDRNRVSLLPKLESLAYRRLTINDLPETSTAPKCRPQRALSCQSQAREDVDPRARIQSHTLVGSSPTRCPELRELSMQVTMRLQDPGTRQCTHSMWRSLHLLCCHVCSMEDRGHRCSYEFYGQVICRFHRDATPLQLNKCPGFRQ